jgi:hypothetical protein
MVEPCLNVLFNENHPVVLCQYFIIAKISLKTQQSHKEYFTFWLHVSTVNQPSSGQQRNQTKASARCKDIK